MKLISSRISKLKNSIVFIMSFCSFAFLFFIAVVLQNRNAEHDNTVSALAGVIISFIIIFGLLYRLRKDIRLRKNSSHDLTANEIIYRNLIENAGVVMYTTSLNGLITFASSKAFQLTNYSMKELIGMHFSELIDSEWLETVKEKYKSQVKNNIVETLIEFCIRTKYGDLK